MLPIGPLEALIVLVVVTLSAAVQTGAGFGLALISAPVVLLVHAPFVPGPLMAASLLLTVLMAWHERSAIDLHGVGWAFCGRLLGTALAAAVVAMASRRAFDLLFGVLVLVAVFLSVAGLNPRPGRGSAVGAGVLSGFIGTISSIGGPPMALLYQREEGARLRSTLAAFFVLSGPVSIVALAFVGRFGWDEVVLTVFLCPAMLAGFYLGGVLRGPLDRAGIRPLVLGLSAASALAVLGRALLA